MGRHSSLRRKHSYLCNHAPRFICIYAPRFICIYAPGPRIRTNAFGRFVGEKRWRLAQAIFDRYHGGAIFFGRAQALLRALVPALAGMNRVPYPTFLKWNVAGTIVFSTIVVLLGYEFAQQLTTLERYLRYWAVIALVIFVAVILFLKRKLEHLLEN